MVLLASTRVVTGNDTGSGRAVAAAATLSIEDDRIVEVTEGVADGATLVDGWIVPGYVDSHNHGAAGASYVDPDPAKVQAAIDHHRRLGATSLIASTVTESRDDVIAQVRQLRALVESGELDGIHLEGPFLAAAKKGAHNEALLCDPAPDFVDEILEAAGGALSMITLAPEREHGLDAVRRFASAGVAPAFGHSDADERVTRESVDAGVIVVTHLFNAMRSIHHREPGPIPWLLTDDRVVVELICDGAHLHRDVIDMAIEAAGVDRVALVTDAMAATGQPDGDYDLGSLKVLVRQGVARLATPDGSPGAIAGSTLTLAKAVEFVVSTVGRTVPEAAVMAATTPARLHHLDQVGVLEPGRLANLCVVDDAGVLQRVMRHGQWLDGGRHE
ncbi:N-acetylglucosamine-6-phosphate deacetylase [Aestuariimicrobium ganziense]|uniref:N-acetylglucosamine-6-phosphate deacetylase n=1 Tax=Aestuariimicrobium ganziense TaxID=2773677 RepID=UPI001941F828|nr:N-acetylglucosamine-6-phosphate deacetylase [Aestuariimicrobium ganziense]